MMVLLSPVLVFFFWFGSSQILIAAADRAND